MRGRDRSRSRDRRDSRSPPRYTKREANLDPESHHENGENGNMDHMDDRKHSQDRKLSPSMDIHDNPLADDVVGPDQDNE